MKILYQKRVEMGMEKLRIVVCGRLWEKTRVHGELGMRGMGGFSQRGSQEKENACDHQAGSPPNPSGHSFFQVKG
jgi:hypothetical protein